MINVQLVYHKMHHVIYIYQYFIYIHVNIIQQQMVVLIYYFYFLNLDIICLISYYLIILEFHNFIYYIY